MAADRRFEPWPYAVAALLAAMIGVSLAFYAVAARNIDAEVVDDSYRAGLGYNDELAARKKAAERGYRIAFHTTPTPEGVSIELQLVDEAGRTISADSASVLRERPTLGGFDREFALESDAEGFRSVIPLPLQGRWQLAATVHVDGEPVRGRIDVWHTP